MKETQWLGEGAVVHRLEKSSQFFAVSNTVRQERRIYTRGTVPLGIWSTIMVLYYLVQVGNVTQKPRGA